jgi:hypothetical protein
VVAAGGQVELAASGSVGEDMIVSAGQATVAGAVAGNITGTVGAYSRTGTVGGTDDVQIREDPQPAQDRTVDRVLDAVQQFVAVLLLGLLALWLAPRVVRAAEGTVRGRPLEAAVWGIVALVGFIVLIVLIAIVMVLLAVGLGVVGLDVLAGLDVLLGIVLILGLSLAYTLAAAFLADAIVGLALARVVDRDGEGAGTDGRPTGRLIVLLAVGAAVIVALTFLPIVGGLIKFVVVVLGTGALLVALRRRGRTEPGQPGPVTEPAR